MRLPHSRPAARRGFSLIELLVVIAVIAVLVGLLMAAVMGLFGKGPEAQDRTDISGMTASLQNFKAKYGFYPPSRLYLASSAAAYTQPNVVNDPLVLDSLQTISAMFPNLPRGWSGINWDGSANMTTPVVLEGDQCLVFFLGGIPGPGPSCAGFSTTTSNPAAAGGQRFDFYKFNPARLKSIHGNAFLSYQNAYDSVSNPPKNMYAYLSVGRRLQGHYNSSWFSPTGGGTGLGATTKTYQQSDCNFTNTSLGVNPYASVWGNPPTFINPDTFQLISPGKDGIFGPGTTSAATVWSTNNTSGAGVNGQDDISNFSDRVLGASQ